MPVKLAQRDDDSISHEIRDRRNGDERDDRHSEPDPPRTLRHPLPADVVIRVVYGWWRRELSEGGKKTDYAADGSSPSR